MIEDASGQAFGKKMVWGLPGFSTATVREYRTVTGTSRSSGDTPIHPDNIGGWVIYPPTSVFWAPNGSGPIYMF